MAEKHALIPDLAAMYTQTDSLKDAKDMSKNLMSGDFERQYGDSMVDKCSRRRQTWLVTLGVVVAALVVWLLALTMVREVQLGRLRLEVDQLTANVIALSADVKSMNQKINTNKLQFGDRASDDAIYTDEDQDITSLADGKDSRDKDGYGSLEKLHGLTVLEDESMADDEDMPEISDDEVQSGMWFPDYDKRLEIGTTNMVHLKPEDLSASVLTFEKDNGKQHVVSNIRELSRLINENPENPDLPTLQAQLEKSTEGARGKRSVFSEAAEELVDQFAAPKAVGKTEERRKNKKYSANMEAAPTNKMALPAVTRTVRNSDNEDGRRPFVAAHFHGNTSHLSTEIHEHYKGNGLVRVAHGAAHDVWYPSTWTIAAPHPRPTLRNGHVHVHNTGVYLVYVQIYYLDSHDIISWVLHRTNSDSEGRDTLLQCAQSSHSAERMDKPNSCFSAAALFLRAGDRLAVRNTGGDRHSLMQPEKSFIGLIKLADAEDPVHEL